MKAAVMLMLLACLCTESRAEWKDLKPGMDQQTAARCVGLPLMQNHGRGGAASWTYDRSGYIHFQYGRVSYWEAPRAPAVVVAKAAPEKPQPSVVPTPSRKSTLALRE